MESNHAPPAFRADVLTTVLERSVNHLFRSVLCSKGNTSNITSRVLVNIIQLLANFDSIQPFPGVKLDDCSMLNVRHFWKMKTHGSQNVFFSYEGNEPIGPKLVYLNKNPPSIEWQKPNVSEMHFEISCTNLLENLYNQHSRLMGMESASFRKKRRMWWNPILELWPALCIVFVYWLCFAYTEFKTFDLT